VDRPGLRKRALTIATAAGLKLAMRTSEPVYVGIELRVREWTEHQPYSRGCQHSNVIGQEKLHGRERPAE